MRLSSNKPCLLEFSEKPKEIRALLLSVRDKFSCSQAYKVGLLIRSVRFNRRITDGDHEYSISRSAKIYLEEGENFSSSQSFGERVVTPVRYFTDPSGVGWVRENVSCQTGCPAGTNMPAYIRMITEKRFGRSYELNRMANVLLGVLGRICSRPCEDACRHGWPGNGELDVSLAWLSEHHDAVLRAPDRHDWL
jgi:hypothetical protein